MPTKINLYAIKYSPPCQAVLMTAKELNIELNMIKIDLADGQHLAENYLKINPAHTVPSIEDNGFILTESRAIMRYLCNSYAPDSPLYPKDVKQKALVDQWLDFDNVLFNIMRDAIARPLFGFPANDFKMDSLKENLGILDKAIGDKKYFVADHLTIADVSVLATTHMLSNLGIDFEIYPNLKRWMNGLKAELISYSEFCEFPKEETMAYMKRLKEFFARMRDQAHQ